jgi:Cu-processing system permease protein
MRQALVIAAKEIRDGIRDRWVLATTILLAAFALTLAFLGAIPTGAVNVSPLSVTVVSLASLSIFLLPLMALLLSYDSFVGEIDRGTKALLLTYPVRRWQVVIGKFLGHGAILGFATLFGFGVAGLAQGLAGETDQAAVGAFAILIVSSIALGGAFLAIGYVVSIVVRDRGAAGGIAIGVWLVFVLIYDMALLGLLVADQGRIVSARMVDALLLFNPTDSYRLLNLIGTEAIGTFAGMAGLAGQTSLSPGLFAGALLAWIVVPLAGAVALFARRPV